MFIKPYGKKRKVVRIFHDEDGNHDGLTEQHHKDSTDINTIIRNYDKTGIISHVAAAKAQYGDFTKVNEYQEALNVVLSADQAFSEVPAKIRAKFGNDAGRFFEFVTNPDNQDELVELGLAERKEEPKPQKVEVVNSLGDVSEGVGTVST